MDAFYDFSVFEISIPGFTTFPYTASFQVMILNWQGETWINDDFPWLMIRVAKNDVAMNLREFIKHIKQTFERFNQPTHIRLFTSFHISLYYTSPGLCHYDRT